MRVNPESIRTVNPSTWPQYPHDARPPTPEQSEARYSVFPQYAKRFRMRDGVELAYDVFRPSAPGQRFPALLSWFPLHPSAPAHADTDRAERGRPHRVLGSTRVRPGDR